MFILIAHTSYYSFPYSYTTFTPIDKVLTYDKAASVFLRLRLPFAMQCHGYRKSLSGFVESGFAASVSELQSHRKYA